MVLPSLPTTGLPIPEFSEAPPFDTSPWIPPTDTPPTAPGVPPTTPPPSTTSPPSSSGGAIPPSKVIVDSVKQKLLRPALTSHFYAQFNPPSVDSIRQYYLDRGETISLLCTEASLPGSSIATNEVNDDYTGITERFAYRRQYDDRADFTFYVDHRSENGGYNIILLFESWMRYALNETNNAEDKNYSYQVNFPDDYRTEMFLTKFERDYNGKYLQYTFVQAYPISISSMPVSYDSSQLLKCTVSFAYNRYIVERKSAPADSTQTEPTRPTVPGVPQPPITTREGDNVPPGYNTPGTSPAFQQPVIAARGVPSTAGVIYSTANTPRTSQISTPLPGTPRLLSAPVQPVYNKNAGTGATFESTLDTTIGSGIANNNKSLSGPRSTSSTTYTRQTTTTNTTVQQGQGTTGPNLGLDRVV